MEDYWQRSLKDKVDKAKSLLVLGNCAKEFIKSKDIKTKTVYLIHPSKRNYSLYLKNKETVLKNLKELIKVYE